MYRSGGTIRVTSATMESIIISSSTNDTPWICSTFQRTKYSLVSDWNEGVFSRRGGRLADSVNKDEGKRDRH